MNVFLMVSGFLALFATVGHLVMGGKSFLRPMLGAEFSPVSKRVMYCVFHFMTVDFAIATLILLGAGFGATFGLDAKLAVIAVIAHFALYGIVQVVMVIASGIEKGLMKIFQWTLFLIIAIVAILGLI
ncbi:MAG: hypothetical protein CMN78_05120 [Spirochaetales bacterium]|nr:hypothetical protein [Spirochaetales bacterium]